MASLLTLPREIRDQIILEVILLPHIAPISPSACNNRFRLQNRFDWRWARTTNIYIEDEQPADTKEPLLRTCRQLRAETQAILRSLHTSHVQYTLDVMFVKHVGILPTWLCFPVVPKQIHTLRIQIRPFSQPQDVNPKWAEDGCFYGTGDGTLMTSWNIMVLLSVYIFNDWRNSTPAQAEEIGGDTKLANESHQSVGHGDDVNSHKSEGSSINDDPIFHYDAFASYTIRNIIIDILEPSLEMYDATVDGEGTVEGNHQQTCNVFANSIFQNKIWVLDQPVPIGSIESQLRPAYRVANGISSAIGLMVTGYPFDLYGERLFSSIGSIKIQVNGIVTDVNDVTHMICCQEGLVLEPDWASSSGQSEEYIDKLLRIVSRRRQHGIWDMKTYERLQQGAETD